MTRRTLTREEIDEQDFNNLVGASSGSEDEGEGENKSKSKPKTKKSDLRALLLDDDGEDDDVWGKAGTAWKEELAEVRGQSQAQANGKKGKSGKDMEITFRPALSAGGSKAVTGDEENMTTLEKYQMRMKEKKARKKEKRELRAAGKATSDAESESEDGAEDKSAKVKGKPSKSAKGDDFFGDSSDDEDEAEFAFAPKEQSKSSKDTKSKSSKAPAQDNKSDLPADLPSELQTTTDHFSMKDILKAEKEKGKKKRRRNKKGKHEDEREVELGPEGWKLDVKDDRFKVLHEEPEFAIDPSNPAYVLSLSSHEGLC
jgi:hypothetical protein